MSTSRRRLPEAPTSTLAELVDAAVEVQDRLDVLLSARKLTFKAFLAEALTIAQCDEKRVDAFGDLLDHAIGADAAKTFVARLSLAFREATYPRPFANLSKALRAHGLEESEASLASLGITPALAQCIAVRRAFKRFGASAFGTIEDFDAHQQAIREAQAELAEVVERMRASVTTSDLLIDASAVSSDERDRGLAKVVFVAWPSVPYGAEDWPARIIASARRHRAVEARAA